ncbi:MAG: TRAM domain-containing protein, partial [Proteobacteria bacterium]|nr:TRAM domain-containing protein [Pseudomonadota bacterium]
MLDSFMPSKIRTQLPTEAVELEIIDLSHDGRGVARFKQKIIFVENALPGEIVSARYTKKTRKFDEAITLKIISASKDRVEPICEYYNDCNGCSMMHLDQSRQIDFKFNALQVLLKKAVNVENINWLIPLTDKHLQYRRRARLSVKWIKAKNKVLVGFRRVDGKHVTEMVGCHTLESGLSALIQPLSELFNSLMIKAFIPQVECSLGDAGISLLIKHTRSFVAKDLCLIEHFGQDHNLQIFFQTKRSNSIKPIKNYTEPVYFKLSHSDLRFDFLPNDFIQVNKGMNDKMIRQAIELLDLQSDDRVLDWFCGIGNFSLP